MIVPTHLDKFGPDDDNCVVSRCKDILERVQQYCESQKARMDYEIAEKKKKGLKNPVQGGTDPEWKKKNPPVISSSLHPSALPVSSLNFIVTGIFVHVISHSTCIELYSANLVNI